MRDSPRDNPTCIMIDKEIVEVKESKQSLDFH